MVSMAVDRDDFTRRWEGRRAIRCFGLTPKGGWEKFTWPRTPSCIAGSRSRRFSQAREKPGQSRSVHRRGRDYRQSGASRGRSGVRVGNVSRRPAVLHDAVYQGRRPGDGDPAVSFGIAPSFTGLEFRWLLRKLIDVCNTVAYAHSRGVLHRDLKPGNIMIGPFGETLVMDWGVAKLIGRERRRR